MRLNKSLRGQVSLTAQVRSSTKEIEASLKELEPQVASIVGKSISLLRWIALQSSLMENTSFLETIQQRQQQDISHTESARNSAYGKSVNSLKTH